MHPLFSEFEKILSTEDKPKSVEFILSRLKNRELDVATTYSELLTPALNTEFCDEGEEECIWKEHIRTSIIKTIVESSYQYLMREIEEKNIKKTGKKVLIASPSDEYHEIGGRMVADFFTLAGFEVIFIGANTPREEFGSAVDYFHPDIVAMSVTNYFHLIEAEKVIKTLKDEYNFKGKIIVGGNAFYSNPDLYKRIGADLMLKTFEDIKNLAEGI